MLTRAGKRKTTTTNDLLPTPERTPNPSLPHDLILSIIARVPRSYYPYLSLVSRSFQSLLASPELYETRSLLQRTESCLYVCLQFPTDPNPYWFTLCRSSCLVSLGSNIYKIGGHINQENLPFRSTNVSILDCRSHTWHKAPSLLVERCLPIARAVDGKIYVVGGNEDNGLESWDHIELFNPQTQTWHHVPKHNLTVHWGIFHKVACVEGKFHLMIGEKCVAYNEKESRWDVVEGKMLEHCIRSLTQVVSYCTVENVLYRYYCYQVGEFRWYDTKKRLWKKVKGMVGLPKLDNRCCIRLADYGGKMAVLWDKDSSSCGVKEKTLWCMEIALEKRGGDEIWGTVEWKDGVLPVPVERYQFVKVLAVTL
ncbi:unnamed protein product [Microthlaspi erraticum]|uniref:Uncharacterized protein n=1 Tax=Microthlaspi erraticum TaxID=1685480 RepID=A0A6D2K0V7_9BRAS|nr:unnamed protein product [Microthlaspi erraticum]